jgi:galactokinase
MALSILTVPREVPMDSIRAVFQSRFGRAAETAVRAPGRVNLIGEHTDYNEGFVLPVAIDMEVCIALRSRRDRLVVLYSTSYDSQIEFDLDRIDRDSENPWSNYARGVAMFLEERGYRLTGLEGVLDSTVPVAAGLSSSAAIELASAWAFLAASSMQKDPSSVSGPPLEFPSLVDLVRLCQRAENEFVGVECGIMDQFIVAAGRQHHALFLDCRSVRYEHVPLPDSVKIVVCNTGVRRELASSEYNRRRNECDQGVDFFRRHLAIATLRDVSTVVFDQLSPDMDPVIRKRCRHVISENERVKESVRVLRLGNVQAFGQLMNESHQSLRHDYQVSCPELDLMVELASQQPGTLGSRMTGAGFGGCTVSLVTNEYVSSFVSQVQETYQEVTGRLGEVYVCGTSNGAGLMG